MDSQSKSNVTALTIITSGIIGGLFIYLSSNEKQYESADCIDLRTYTHFYGIFSVAIAIFTLLVYLASLIFKDAGCFSGLDCLQLLFGIIGTLFLILFAVALYKKEPCGHLRIFTIIYLLFMSIILCCQFGLISMTMNNKEKHNE